MKIHRIRIPLLGGLFALLPFALLEAKPLKVFILAGQSNMEGHAQTSTFPAIAKDPKTADLHKQMVDAGGKPVVCKDVWISYAYGDFGGAPIGRKAGQLTSGWGSQHHVGTGKTGPELMFGITMQKELGEPILLIKNAWGGKSLMVDFRPPGAGEPTDEKQKEKAGKYYAHMMEHVKEVLSAPGKVYPDYDPKEGFELAGFVWFQGFNDLVGSYPSTDPGKGKKAVKDYSEYSRLLACFIRDVRKDLGAPGLPFVTGVLGVGGDSSGDNAEAFRKAMAAPAEMEEFKGTVSNVFTHKYWPVELDEVRARITEATAEFEAKGRELKARSKKGEDLRKEIAELTAAKNAKIDQTLNDDEKFLIEKGISNQGFHYHGSAKFFAQIGKAFAEAAIEMNKKR